MPAPKDGRPPKPKRGPRTLRVLSTKQALAILRLRASIKAAQADRAALAVIFSRVPIPQGGTRPTRFTPTQREALTNLRRSLAESLQALYLFQRTLWGAAGARFRDVPLQPTKPPQDDVWKLNARILQLETEVLALRRLWAVRRELGDRYRDEPIEV